MQQDHPAIVQHEEHSGDPVGCQAATHLPEARSKGSAGRHTDWPAIFDGSDVIADRPPVFNRQGFDELPDRLCPLRRPIKRGRDFLDGYQSRPLILPALKCIKKDTMSRTKSEGKKDADSIRYLSSYLHSYQGTD